MIRLFRALLLTFIAVLSACATQPTATPTPSATATRFMTATVSAAQLTAAVGLRPTFPATFTPTATASASPTPTDTLTPSITPTPTIIPERALCERFGIAAIPPAPEIYRTRPVLLEVVTTTDRVTVDFALYEAEAETPFFTGNLSGGVRGVIEILLSDLPAEGVYRWQATLSDDERSGLCPIEGVFEYRLPEPEVTPEVTAEVTAEITAEVTAEPES